MLKKRTLTLAVIFTALIMCNLVAHSQEFKIEEMGPQDGSTDAYKYGNYLYENAHVRTNAPFYCVWWYVDGEFAGWSDGSNVNTEATFCPYWLEGSLRGNSYLITAEVGWLADDGTSHILSRSYKMTVWEPYSEYTKSELMDVYGYREVTKQYYKHPAIIAECKGYAYNNLEKGGIFTGRSGWINFYHEVTGPNINDAVAGVSDPGIFPNKGIYGPYFAYLPISIETGRADRRYKSKVTISVIITGRAPREARDRDILATESIQYFDRQNDN